ncbi:MAG: ATP-binding protein [Sterolibacterium sp.]
MSDGSLTSSAFRNRLALGVLLINLFVFGLAGQSLLHSRDQYQQQAEGTSQNLAYILDQYIATDFDKIDMALLIAADEIDQQIADGHIDSLTLNLFLSIQQSRLPNVETLWVVDAQGIVTYGLGIQSFVKVDISDKDFFIRLRDALDAGLVIGKPEISPINKKWVLNFARRLSRPDGSFAGVIYSSIDIENFSRLFSVIDVGKLGVVSLRDAEMGLVASYPEREDLGIGSRRISKELQQLVQAGKSSGTYFTLTSSDNIPRTQSFRKVGNHPLYIVAGLASEEYLAEWRGHAGMTALLAALFLLITLLMSWLLYLGWKRQQSSVAALAVQETKFRTVADFTYDWEYWEGARGEILYMTPSCKHITGYGHDEFVADPGLLDRIVFPEDQPLMYAHRHDVAHQEAGNMDFRIVRCDGEVRWIAHACRAVLGADGQFNGRRVSNRDITERKLAEQTLRERSEALQQSNADLEQFAYSVSHDMRSPLRSVMGHLQLLEKGIKDSLDADNCENLAYALESAKRMDAMIVSLLDYSRVGRKTGAKQWLESRAPLDEALGFLDPACEEARAVVSVSGEWPKVFASRDELSRLFQNLIGNALKYREAEQPPRVEVVSVVSGVTGDAGEQRWRVSVRDHGIGIDPQQIGRLFQFFSRLQSRARYEGTGMGLALCRRIVEHHAGCIWVESAGEGQGSTFIFEIPLQVPEAGEPTGARP